MQALKVGDLRLVAGLHQGIKTCLYQLRHSTTKNCLLPEKIGLGFFFESGFNHPGSGGTQSFSVCESRPQGIAGGILVNGNQ